jgi:hypothetical protein
MRSVDNSASISTHAFEVLHVSTITMPIPPVLDERSFRSCTHIMLVDISVSSTRALVNSIEFSGELALPVRGFLKK